MTRKKKKQLQKTYNSDSDTDSEIEDEYKYVQIDVAVDDLYKRRQLRQKLLNTVFNKRDFDIIFDFDNWPYLQESDEELRLVLMYITMDPKIMDRNSKWYKMWCYLKKGISNAIS